MKRVSLYIIALLITATVSSCGKFYKLEKSTDWDKLYSAANEYYEKGDYNKAIILYDKVLPVIRGSERSELAEFNYAYSHFRIKRYIEAAGYFKSFYDTYNRSPMAEEALFMNAYALYLDAPDFNLDQRSSRDAVNAIQLFINRFPQSDSYERAMTMIDDLQRRFEEKAYQESKMYYRLTEGLFPGEFYRACIINFQNFAKSYPDSKYNEELAYKLVEVSAAYAERSVFNKKEERLNQSINFADTFKRRYPNSEFGKKVENLFTKTQSELVAHQKLKKEYDARTAAAKEAAEEEKRNKEATEALRNADNQGN
ncbi:outer membrane protein assembly factor BamD [Litoribacter ruber]|uniref:Outer membrane protein assembly factor BamD n=1 Tax=Litoribacter ruber TaxID=702568 RepID=A0AAP2CF94_9BACT|nr:MULTISPECIES: outer membrane protein assembly factor BamD [Litoribacter]MBS9522610.1 outer membrane protein assembly factor BamD [Litoribacter alkaliphilus]MBT0811139.1 outer membrane protein assembly factor BamD [Litoribacter ruber]